MFQIEKYGWKYQSYKKNGKIRFDVLPPEELIPNDTLFRYYSSSQYSIDSVVNNYLYASHPDQFNDIYDCHEELFDFDDEDAVIHFLSGGEEESTKKLKIAIAADRQNVIQSAQRNFRQIIYRKLGIVCMTSNPNNILMWSYYTNHRGFLVEYAYKEFPFDYHGPFPVNYQAELEKLSLKEVPMPLCVLFQSNVKHKGWEHESEWRILIENPEGEMSSPELFSELLDLGGRERKFTYPSAAIKSIVLGHYFIEPKELTILDDKVFEIKILKNNDRVKLLDYIDANSITAGYTSKQSDLKNVAYYKGKIKKIEEGKYHFTRID